ncbi:MAG TPA: sugar phosphate isomerase/epimerase family protein [Chloroflexota bacterium]|jgi:sugar phosphate isomerase/epimerase|nr:sugar phosphate isomerase/epimerase family protein [Chloroflexota bacterium]
MPRPVTLFTGQWADLPLETLARKAKSWGYDGLELCSWGDHFDVLRAAEDRAYAQGQRDLLKKHGLNVWAFSIHLAGQLVCDEPLDERHVALYHGPPEHKGRPDAMRKWAIELCMAAPRAATNLGVEVVTGFTGSSIWHLWFPFPPQQPAMIEAGFKHFAERWNPILGEFGRHGVRFALEVHPSEIAYDLYTAARAIEAVGGRKEFGFNFDPSHLIWQFVDPSRFIYEFPDRIYHCHVKDAKVLVDGRSSILSSHLGFGDRRRGWDFVSPGHGDVQFEPIIRALNRTGYQGPLSVEWEDSGMDREHGAAEAVEFVRKMDFPPSAVAFDAAFQR